MCLPLFTEAVMECDIKHTEMSFKHVPYIIYKSKHVKELENDSSCVTLEDCSILFFYACNTLKVALGE